MRFMNKDILHSRATSNLHAVQQANFYCLRHAVWWNDSNALKPLPISRLCVHQMSSGLAVWREWRTWPYHWKCSFCLVEMPSLPVFGHGEKDGNQVPPTWNSRGPSSYHKRNTLESTSLDWKRTLVVVIAARESASMRSCLILCCLLQSLAESKVLS